MGAGARPGALPRRYALGAVVLAIALAATYVLLTDRPGPSGGGGFSRAPPPAYAGPGSPPGPNESVALSPTATSAAPTNVTFHNYSFSLWWIVPNASLGISAYPPGGPRVNVTMVLPKCPVNACQPGAPVEWRSGGSGDWGIWWFIEPARIYVWVAAN